MSDLKDLSAAMSASCTTNGRLVKEVGTHQGAVKNSLDGAFLHWDCAKRAADYFGKTRTK